MPSVCLFFHMHQPRRLRRYSVFDTDADYFDEQANAGILRRVTANCYDPAARAVLELVRRHEGRFRVSFAVTGVLLEQLRAYEPAVVNTLVELAETGFVEFVNVPYYHSLAFLYSRDEFREQVQQHARAMEDLLGQRARVFANTELIYNNDLAYYLESMGGYIGALSEGVDGLLAGRPPDQVYRPPHCDRLALLMRNYKLSDDVAFRFSEAHRAGQPLTAKQFAQQVSRIGEDEPGDQVCNLFMDFEALGEHQKAETGIFRFLDELPDAVLRGEANHFRTVGEAIDACRPADQFDAPHMISWADTERDLSAWLGNAMQSNALHELYKLEQPIKELGDEKLLADWRALTVSDHFYYMSTKYFADGQVHSYFNPYESPYDSYINFMNVLDSLRSRAGV